MLTGRNLEQEKPVLINTSEISNHMAFPQRSNKGVQSSSPRMTGWSVDWDCLRLLETALSIMRFFKRNQPASEEMLYALSFVLDEPIEYSGPKLVINSSPLAAC